MRAKLGIALAVAATAGTPSALAGDFDGSKPLICATVQALECVAGEDCVRGRAADIGAPTFMRIDFARKVVIGPQRTSPVQLMEESESQLLLQGTERGFAWSIALDKDTGEMSATLVDRDGAIILFGACTVP
jgi:hypothetical protein